MSDSYWDHIKDDFGNVSIYDGSEVFEADVSKLTDYAGDLLATHWFLSEMSNGGIWQFFDNPTGVVAERAIRGFANMGLPQVADTLRQAVQKFETVSTDAPPELFESEEKAIYSVGGKNLAKIYACMDAYAEKRS